MARKDRRRGNGEGTIQRVGNRYVARASVPGSGGAKRKAFSGKTRAEANAKMVRWLTGVDPRVEAKRITVADYLRHWLEVYAKHTVALNTLDRYICDVKNHLAPPFEGLLLDKATTFHVEKLKAELIDKGLAPNTITRILSILSAAFNVAVRDGLAQKNPAKGVKRPKAAPKKMRSLSEEQVVALLGVVRDTRHEALYFVACRLGLREGELCGLSWEEVDLEGGSLHVYRSVSAHAKGVRWGGTKTGAQRTIALDLSEVAALKRHRKLQAEERIAAKGWRDEGLVFPGTRGQVKRRSPLLDELRRHCERAGLPRITFHDLRHTAASLMVGKGIPIRTVSDILGHANPAMTLNRYAHVLPSHQSEAAARRGGYAF